MMQMELFSPASHAVSHIEVTVDTGVATLTNETNGWRLYSYELKASRPLSATNAKTAPSGLFGVNYYPSQSPWKKFWPEFDSTIFARDLRIIRDLGGNSVRFFMQPSEFLDPKKGSQSLASLSELLDLAVKRSSRQKHSARPVEEVVASCRK